MSKVRIFEVGERYGLLTVTQRRDTATPRVLCRCDCGTEFSPEVKNLATGRTRSCGCVRRGSSNPRWTGARDHPLYSAWCGMKERCANPNHTSYARYGGRGITVCDRWRNDFWAFVADMGDRPDGHSLDRVDNDGNYEPSNCRWASASEQNLNQDPRPLKATCHAGHKFTPENTRVVSTTGVRVCLTCEQARARTYRQRAAS